MKRQLRESRHQCRFSWVQFPAGPRRSWALPIHCPHPPLPSSPVTRVHAALMGRGQALHRLSAACAGRCRAHNANRRECCVRAPLCYLYADETKVFACLTSPSGIARRHGAGAHGGRKRGASPGDACVDAQVILHVGHHEQIVPFTCRAGGQAAENSSKEGWGASLRISSRT